MPRYDFKCDVCLEVVEHWAKIEERNKVCSCGGNMKRLISSSYGINADFATKDFVTDNISGNPIRINSKKQLRALQELHGVTEKIGKGWY